MPISGPVVHRQLIEAYANVQTRLEQERQRISSSREERDGLEDHRGDALAELAEHYLPELSAEAIQETWGEVRGSVADILMRKEDQERRVKAMLSQANAKREQLESELIAINADFDAALESQQQTAKEVEQALRQSAAFVQLSDRAAVAEAALERAEANLQEIDQEAARKLPAYDNSSLFRYLYDRRFGTKRYTKRGFTRRADRWLAKFIDFHSARQSYEFLQQTPEKMREIIASDRDAFDTVMNELERHRDEVAETLGLQEKVSQTQRIQTKRDAQLKLLNAAVEETNAIEAELTQLEDPRGPYYRQAITVFRKMLEKMNSRELRDRAKQTQELTDDQIVARLVGVESEIDALKQTVEDRRNHLVHMQKMMDTLGQVIQRFRALQFDSSRSQFVGTLDVLDDLYRASNVRDVEEIWERIRSSQRWGPTAAEKITRAAAHPMAQILANAMEQAAAAAMQTHARRAGQRRDQNRKHWDGGDSSSGDYRKR
ncbi:hypothetical protein Pla52o_27070 [Novipirellula galeiformis]|uniref:Chromosome partition protein Smc n=1 Tax=Novipirellula galeiformis TaxID=2528004 RepID=A0A5C6CG65_9BACT|nr:hypothetical protein [Novipirellula galeiformis]TWU23172.1 hypothetical protein Pla52o_27070 [Novipirellula galeiformis]